MKAFNISDNPLEIKKNQNIFFENSILLNINTNRLFWHSGAGIDPTKHLIGINLLEKFLECKEYHS